jgi:hypothetical protein
MDLECCPACGAELRMDDRGGAACRRCGAVYAEPLTVCPRCGQVNEKGAAVCVRCAADLLVACPGCGRIHWAGAERCSECGRELDSLGHAFRSFNKSFRLRQEESQRILAALREKEERESQFRIEALRSADDVRMRRLSEAAAGAKKRERRIIIGAGIMVAGFLALAVAAAVFLL